MARTRLYPPSVDPGFPELATTPDGWQRTTFSEVLKVVERPVKLAPNEKYRLLTARRSRGGITLRGELQGHEILTKTQFEAKGGDFLISRRQIIHGACGVVPDELDGAIVSNEYSTLRPRANLLLDFLRYFSHTPYFQRTCFHSSHGVDVEKMIFKIDEWLVRPFDLPPVSEQRKIAAILSSVDDAIEATQAVMDQFGVVKKALMTEFFTRGLPGRHTRFKQTDIGEVPKEWSVVEADAIFAEGPSNGRSPPSKALPPGIPTFSIAAVRSGRVKVSAHLKYAQVEPNVVRSALVRKHDILIVRGNGNSDLVGCCGRVVDEPPFGCFYPDILMRVRLIESMDDAFFISLWNSEVVHSQILDKAKTTNGTYKINGQDVRSVYVPVPPIEEQRLIGSVLQTFELRCAIAEEELSALRSLKSALMSVLLTGELRVKPDEAVP